MNDFTRRRSLSEQVRPANDHRETNSPAKVWATHDNPLEITPTKSVIDGWNGTVSGLISLAESLERSRKNGL